MKRKKTEMPGKNTPGIRKIRNALADLGDCWMYATEFKEAYNIGDADLTRYLKNFPDNYCLYSRTRILSGDPATIRHIQENLGA